LLVAQHLSRDYVDGLRGFQQQPMGAHHRTGRWRLVAGAVLSEVGAADGSSAEVDRAIGRHRLQRQGSGVDLAEGEAGLAQQTLQRLACSHRPADRRGIEAVGRFIGVDHADTGDPAELAQRLRQWLGRQGKLELSALLLLRLGNAKRQQRQPRYR